MSGFGLLHENSHHVRQSGSGGGRADEGVEHLLGAGGEANAAAEGQGTGDNESAESHKIAREACRSTRQRAKTHRYWDKRKSWEEGAYTKTLQEYGRKID